MYCLGLNPRVALLAGALTSVVIFLMVATCAAMTVISFLRRRRIYANTEDVVQRMTVNRTVAIELGFFVAQSILLALNTWSLAGVEPETPKDAVAFYYAAHVGRTMVSLILGAITVNDLLLRGRIHRALNQQNVKALLAATIGEEQ